MQKIIFRIEILNVDANFENFLLKNSNMIDLGKGISVFKESNHDEKLKMKIQINVDETKSYDPSLRNALLSNIIASWLIYNLTGKNIELLIENNKISLKKNSLKSCFENLFKNNS